jgi:rod shape-determining protein MreC
VPRNRSARLAVLGSSQRSTSSSYPPRLSGRFSGPVKRRIVLGVLVVVSLVLITVYFRESDGGALHSIQNVGSTILRPFEVAATRVAHPFQDLYNYVRGLVDAKSERDKLQAELDRVRKRLIRLQFAAQQNKDLQRSLKYISGPSIPKDFRPVTAEIISKLPSQFEQRVVIAAGSADGIQDDDPVVTAHGLVGKISKTASHQAQVTLLTDEDTAVSAIDVDTRAEGIVRHGSGRGTTLFLDKVAKSAHVALNNRIVTAGWHQGSLSSIYPKGIPIGIVSSASFPSTDLYASVQIAPYVDFSALDSVIVLVKKKR